LILVIKRMYWPPTLYVFVAAAVVVAVMAGVITAAGELAKRRRLCWCGVGLLWLAWGLAFYRWHHAATVNHTIQLHPTKPVVCIGDSLTSGVRPYGGYPDDLADLLAVPVINLGQPGITAEEALRLLPKLREAKPQVVVIELGGHDFLKGRGRAATKSDLEKLIDASHELGAEVVLMEVPRGFIVDPFVGIERELAYQRDLELISDSAIRNLVLFSPHAPPGMWIGEPHLSDDGLHPNANGNTYLAERVAKTLVRMYGIDIRSNVRAE
jgi:lysophospholipase L1-like esterase